MAEIREIRISAFQAALFQRFGMCDELQKLPPPGKQYIRYRFDDAARKKVLGCAETIRHSPDTSAVERRSMACLLKDLRKEDEPGGRHNPGHHGAHWEMQPSTWEMCPWKPDWHIVDVASEPVIRGRSGSIRKVVAALVATMPKYGG